MFCMSQGAECLAGGVSCPGRMKDKTINVRLDANDVARLEELAAHYALSASSVIRMLLKKAHDELPKPEGSSAPPTQK